MQIIAPNLDQSLLKNPGLETYFRFYCYCYCALKSFVFGNCISSDTAYISYLPACVYRR